MEEQELSVPEKMNLIVNEVVNKDKINGFQKAYVVANSIVRLKGLLSKEYMKPIMELQNSRLGFKTDRPSRNNPTPYSENEVKECLIEAVFLGLQPYGNEFNIIAGNCYPTKEGLGALLSKFNGLQYNIVPELPRVNGESAAVGMLITWTLYGTNKEQRIEIPIRVNKMMGTDAILGKATRKARAWLYGTVTGQEIVDGDVTDVDFKIVEKTKSIQEIQTEQSKEEVIRHIYDAKNKEDLSILREAALELGLNKEYKEALNKF